jgi:hypothetical protein
VNDTVVILLPRRPSEAIGAPRDDLQFTIWALLLPEVARRLPTELAAVESYVEDERFLAS